MPSLCKVCDLPDWENPEFLTILDDLNLSFGRTLFHRKHWEFAQAIYGLRKLGCLTEDTVAVGIGSGHEHPVYYFANVIGKVHATDIYGEGIFNQSDAPAEMLVWPERFAKFPYRQDHLVVQYMNGCELKYPDSCFDMAFSFSSIEHFGGHVRSGDSVREMARVLRPGGIAVLTTELILNQTPHEEFFLPDELDTYLIRPSGLHLIEDIDFTITPGLVSTPVRMEDYTPDISPVIVLQAGQIVFTSVLLFLQKPVDWAMPETSKAPVAA